MLGATESLVLHVPHQKPLMQIRPFLFIATCVLLAKLSVAQTLYVDTSTTANYLADYVLATADITVSNASYTGHPYACGRFDGIDSNIGLTAGVILSTGMAIDAIGPNDSTLLGNIGTEYDTNGDATLESLLNIGSTYDAAVLEFDFTAPSDLVFIKYVFASNEYMDYVGADFFDAFGIFLSGPGILGETNIATMPNSEGPITINTINAVTNQQYYVDNTNPLGESVAYNGFTVPLTAEASVTPSETYHLKIVIADGGDRIFDSALFLQEYGFGTSAETLSNSSIATQTISTYPNPTEGIITWNTVNAQTAEVFDNTGRSVLAAAQPNGSIDISELTEGIYILKLFAEEGTYTSRIAKQ